MLMALVGWNRAEILDRAVLKHLTANLEPDTVEAGARD